jgi:hypothetical protein
MPLQNYVLTYEYEQINDIKSFLFSKLEVVNTSWYACFKTIRLHF